jgi:hypothetical protein
MTVRSETSSRDKLWPQLIAIETSGRVCIVIVRRRAIAVGVGIWQNGLSVFYEVLRPGYELFAPRYRVKLTPRSLSNQVTSHVAIFGLYLKTDVLSLELFR